MLAFYHLVPFLHESRLVDTTTGLSIRGFLKSALVCNVSLISRNHAFLHIFESSSELTSLKQGSVTTNVNVHQHILTNGLPVHDRAQRLPPEKLAVAK